MGEPNGRERCPICRNSTAACPALCEVKVCYKNTAITYPALPSGATEYMVTAESTEASPDGTMADTEGPSVQSFYGGIQSFSNLPSYYVLPSLFDIRITCTMSKVTFCSTLPDGTSSCTVKKQCSPGEGFFCH